MAEYNGISVYVNGVLWADKITSLEWTDDAQTGISGVISTITDKDWLPDFEPEPLQTVTIKDELDTIIVTGLISAFPSVTTLLRGKSYMLQFKGWEYLAELKYPLDVFRNMAYTDMYKSMVSKYLPDHDATEVPDILEIGSLDYRGNKSLKQALDEIATLLGKRWYVDNDKKHHLEDPYINKYATILDDDNCATEQCTRFANDMQQLANRVWVEGGEAPALQSTEQYMGIDMWLPNVENEAAPASKLYEGFTYKIPIWSKCDGLSAFMLIGKKGTELTDAKHVPVRVRQFGDGGKTVAPASWDDQALLLSQIKESQGFMPSLTLTSPGKVPDMPGVGSHSTLTKADYDLAYDPAPTDLGDGGLIYVPEGIAKYVYSTEGVMLDIDTMLYKGVVTSADDKLQDGDVCLGFLFIYRRIINLSIRTPVDSDSLAKYGVQIDLPKEYRPDITSYSQLKRYVDFLLMKHKDPPKTATIVVRRRENGSNVYNHAIKSGSLVDVELTRFGTEYNVQVTQVRHIVDNKKWYMTLSSSVDPMFFVKGFLSLKKEIAALQYRQTSDKPIESTVERTEGLVMNASGVITTNGTEPIVDIARVGRTQCPQ